MSMEALLSWGIPTAALGLAAIVYGVLWYGSWRFDKQYPDSPK